MPDSFVAISLDGVNNNDNFNKSTEGFFAMVTPRQDAVEAVTVTTAGGGADVGGHGAVQIAFVTRSGTNRFTRQRLRVLPQPELNTNYWFNENNGLPKNDVVLNQYGFRAGRSDRHSEALRRARQGVLLLQLRRAPAAEQLHADADDSASARRRRALPLQRDVGRQHRT